MRLPFEQAAKSIGSRHWSETIRSTPLTGDKSPVQWCIWIVSLQGSGAYGFSRPVRTEGAFSYQHPAGLRNFKWFLSNKQVGIVLPEFERMLGLMVQEEVVTRFEPVQADETTPLVVHINSFSIVKQYPKIKAKWRRFVFDCRGS